MFLIRQYFLTIPREMDEAAALDGAGPFRTLVSVILPQCVAGDRGGRDLPLRLLVERLLRAAHLPPTKPDLQPLAVGLPAFNGIHYRESRR